ncbi:MAG: metallopeptidase family protein [Gemmatimonadetes bacterium]|nr:metallopeptidase family protein [Gemmatimonadota bacterium]
MEEHDVPDDLLGLYAGIPLEDKGLAGDQVLPDRIYIFRDNLVKMCESREELIAEIRVTVLHEIGHHFGLDEDRLEALGYD